MIIGVPREAMNIEHRAAFTPSVVTAFVYVGYRILVENMSGNESGFTNEEYDWQQQEHQHFQ